MVSVTAPKSRLASRCAHQFTRRAIERAALYVEHGLIELREGANPASERAYAVVRGSRARPYVVVVNLAELPETGSVATGCTCPHATDGSLCKHVFAVLLALDHREAPLAPGDHVELPRGPALTVDPIVLIPYDPALLEAKDLAWFGAEPTATPAATPAPRPSARPAAAGPRSTSAVHGATPSASPSTRPTSSGRRSGLPSRAEKEPTPFEAAEVRSTPPALEATAHAAARGKSAARRDIPDWQVRLYAVRRAAIALPGPRPSPLSAEEPPRRIHFVIDVDMSLERGGLVVGLFEERETHGSKKRPRPVAIGVDELDRVPDPKDRAALKLLSATPLDGGARPSIHGQRRRTMHESLVPESLYELVLPALAATGRLECQGRPVTFDAGPAWSFGLVVRPDDAVRKSSEREWLIGGRLHRGGDEAIELEEPLLLLADGLVLLPGRLARLDAKADFPWVVLLRSTPGIRFPERAMPEVLAELGGMYELPPLYLEAREPPPWRIGTEVVLPQLILGVPGPRSKHVEARLSFGYGAVRFAWGGPASGELDRPGRRLVLRDRRGERACLELLRELGVRRRPGGDVNLLEVPVDRVRELVDVLTQAGWDLHTR